MGMSTYTFDQTFEALVGLAGGIIVLAASWIVSVLIQIEKTKASAFSSVLDDTDGNGGDLQFVEEQDDETSKTGHIEMTDQPHHLEVEREKGTVATSPKSATSPRSPTRRRHLEQQFTKSNNSTSGGRARRRVPWSFVWIQIASVGALILLTYLLLVVSNAPVVLRSAGSLVVFGVFLRFQIGEEIRRQRLDRIVLLLSLFLVIASMLSLLCFSMKTLKQGEIYEGPARIVGYDLSQYNNSKHDPTTRTDIAVSWGKDWGCPLSGGKVCQSQISGAMCQVHPDKEQTKHKPNYGGRRRTQTKQQQVLERQLQDEQEEEQEEEALEEDLEDEEDSNQELESENENLEKENEELKEEIEELKEENEIDEEEVEETEEEETSEIYEVEDEYDEEIMDLEEEVDEVDEDYDEEYYKEDENEIKQQLNTTDDPDKKEELTEELEQDKEDESLVKEEYEEVEEEYEEYAEDYAEYAEEDAEDAEAAEEEVEDLEDEKEEIEDEVDDIESEVEKEEDSTSNHGTSTEGDEEYTEEEEVAEEIEEAEEEEVVEEYEEDEYGDEEWYWDEYPEGYDDDWYEDEYWNYDWDSVWGEYACEDLFDSDLGTNTFDPNTPAGGDDEWPFIYIYGSCKTCEAYILDYFAEEAFEALEDYKKQAVIYMAGAIAGFIASFFAYVKYRVMPTAENEIELLGDGGVMA